MSKTTFTPPHPSTSVNDETPHSTAIVGSVDPIGIVGSVDPIGIASDSPDVSSGSPFSLHLTLSAPPAPLSTVGVSIAPAVFAGNASVNAPGVEDVSIHFSNLDVHVHATASATASAAVTHSVVPLVPNQAQQSIHLTAPVVTAPGQYTVSVQGRDQNNMPTPGVSITITVHP